MSVSRSENVYKDAYNRLEEIHSVLQEWDEKNEVFNTPHVDKAVKKFLDIEKSLFEQNENEIDAALKKKMLSLIHHIKNSPAIETMLGTMQTQFFHILQRIEHQVDADSKGKKVEKVNLEQLDF